MTDIRRVLETPRGRFELRPEQPQDGPFLFKLFHDHTARLLRFAGAGPEAIENLIAVQFKSQTTTYHRRIQTRRSR